MFGDMMKQALEMKGNMEKMQEDLLKFEVVGQAGGGLVKVSMNGKHGVKNVEIDDSLLSDDKDMLEDLVLAAMNDAVRKVERETQDKYANAFSGLNLPAGMKLPF